MPMSIYSIFKYRIKVLTEESTNYLYQILPTHSLVPSVAGGLSGGCRVVKGAGLKIRSRMGSWVRIPPPAPFSHRSRLIQMMVLLHKPCKTV